MNKEVQQRRTDQSTQDHRRDGIQDLIGSEIEQAIMSGLFMAFAEGRELTTGDIMTAIADTNPLSSLMAEKIESLRTWADNRCVSAD